jgi:hypothetical protein
MLSKNPGVSNSPGPNEEKAIAQPQPFCNGSTAILAFPILKRLRRHGYYFCGFYIQGF